MVSADSGVDLEARAQLWVGRSLTAASNPLDLIDPEGGWTELGPVSAYFA